MRNYTNLEIAELLRNVAAAYQLRDAEKNKFRIIAYERAADAVEHATSELKDLFDEGNLDEVPGIGKSIAEHLGELFTKGESKHFNELLDNLPKGIFELMKIPGIGVKTASRLVNELDIKSIDDLEKAIKAGKVEKLEGFGTQSQESILKSILETKNKDKARILLPYASEIALEVIEWMKALPSVKRVDPLGSLRRKAATIGDIDISVACDKPKEAIEHFARYPKAQRVLEKGDISAGIVVAGEVHVDLMVQPVASYGSLLQHFTGSKHHNIALREYALKKGLSLSEKGIKQLKDKDKKLKTFDTEEKFYKELGLNWIPPEMREDTGEIETSANNKLPKLVEIKDIKGDLQMHSSFDIETSHDLGLSSMEDLVKKANTLGYEYIALTEHNPSKSRHTESEIVDILKRKRETVDQLNYSVVKDMKERVRKVFNSLEIDILPDGRIPVPDEGMDTLDFALLSIHSSFTLPREEMTKRILSALAHPKVKIFAHPTARKLNEREGVEIDWEKVFDYCVKNNKWLEINADPTRLDLPDSLVRDAVKAGVKLTLGTDAHHADSLDNMIYGVYVARRGWAEKKDIVNTRSLKNFEEMLE